MSSSDYTQADIEQYMRSRIDSTDSGKLFEFGFQNDCREEIDELGVARNSGSGVLFSFTAIAAGWRPEAARRLLGSGPDGLGMSDDFDAIATADLELVNDAAYGGHSHRHANGAHPDRALRSLSSMSVDGKSTNSMGEALDRLTESPDPFDEAMSVFERVDTFGSLSAFDFLELAVRVNERTEIAPERLETHHVDRNGPKETLSNTLENEHREGTSVQSDEGQRLLDELVEFARTDLGVEETAAMFDVESCLCTYHGELENEGPDWRGSCS
ncbi:MAG: hypothetical protein V5A27_00215 [Halapricum sp.]